MRVLDLLQLLFDYPKNTPVRVRSGATTQNIAAFQEAVVAEQARLVLQPQAHGKPLKCWELMVLLDRPDWRQRFLYVAEQAAPRPLFGFQDQGVAGLVLN